MFGKRLCVLQERREGERSEAKGRGERYLTMYGAQRGGCLLYVKDGGWYEGRDESVFRVGVVVVVAAVAIVVLAGLGRSQGGVRQGERRLDRGVF